MNQSFGIAFGGGGARGLAHIHVVEAFDELGIKPKTIAGSSIGAIIGAAIASGMSGRDIRDYAYSVLADRSEVASRIWQSRPQNLADLLKNGLHISQFNIERALKAFLPEDIPQTFAELKIPLKITATDYYGYGLAVLEEGDLISAIGASAALPAVFKPVMRDGVMLIDGGIYNPVPFDLIEDEADIVIAVDVIGGPLTNGEREPSSIDLMFGATQLMMQSILENKLMRSQPHILIRPPVSKFRVLDFLNIDTILTQTANVKDEVKRKIDVLLR
ncbi:patatin-like phospholipase family protein [Aquamicrobium segne]|uniref:Patatin-like phospholipase family protein n=1 Tax=Aquamicrobium segne TaxID=469547 RepID=A0ABW0GZ57_9HYPH